MILVSTLWHMMCSQCRQLLRGIAAIGEKGDGKEPVIGGKGEGRSERAARKQ